MAWNPEQYLKFAGKRFRPAADLLARVGLDAPSAVFDLGCGVGAATGMLRARWPDAAVTGVDASSEMLERATRESDGAKISWVQADIAGWAPDQPADLIFSNAALHWLDDHDRLFPRLLEHIVPAGALPSKFQRTRPRPRMPASPRPSRRDPGARAWSACTARRRLPTPPSISTC